MAGSGRVPLGSGQSNRNATDPPTIPYVRSQLVPQVAFADSTNSTTNRTLPKLRQRSPWRQPIQATAGRRANLDAKTQASACWSRRH